MSKYKLPFRVSASTSGITTQSVTNAMPASQEEAPYLFKPEMAGHMTQDELNDLVVKASGGDINLSTQRLVWDAAIAVIGESAVAGVKVDAGACSAEIALTGTVPYSNSQPTPENELYINLIPKKSFRDAVEKIPYADSATGLPFVVRTITEPLPSGRAPEPGNVTPGNTAYLNGSDFTSDIAVSFVDKTTGEKTAATVTSVLTTVATLTVPDTLCEGVYALEVTCTGKGATPVTMLALGNVNVGKNPNMTLRYLKDDAQTENNVTRFLDTTRVVVKGTNLGEVTCDDILLRLTTIAGVTTEEHPVATDFTASEGELVFASGLLPSKRLNPDGDWIDGTVVFVVTKNGKTVELPFDYCE